MSYLPDHLPDVGLPGHGLSHQARKALHVGQDTLQQNPLPIVLGALLIGVIVGTLCSRREPKPRAVGDMARELIDETLHRVIDRLPRLKDLELAEKVRRWK